MLPGAAARLFKVDRVRHTLDRGHAQTTSGQFDHQAPHKLRFLRTLADQAEGFHRATPFLHHHDRYSAALPSASAAPAVTACTGIKSASAPDIGQRQTRHERIHEPARGYSEHLWVVERNQPPVRFGLDKSQLGTTDQPESLQQHNL